MQTDTYYGKHSTDDLRVKRQELRATRARWICEGKTTNRIDARIQRIADEIARRSVERRGQ